MNSRNRNGVLILAIVLAFFSCYKFAISNTLELKEEYKNLINEEALLKDRPKQFRLWSRKQVYFDSILNKMNLGNTSFENNLLRVINLEAKKNNLKVLDFNEPHVSSDQNNTLNTFEFVLEGGYTALLKAVHAIEQENNFGEIIHLQFEKKRNYRKNSDYLTSRILIQQIN